MISLDELYKRFLTTGYTVACDKLAEGEKATDPYILYHVNFENYSADGVVYASVLSIDLYLISKNINFEAEEKIEQLLKNCFYEKERAFIQKDKYYQTFYEIGGIGNVKN